MTDQAFAPEQQEYLKGFMSGVEARRGALGFSANPAGGAAPATDPADLQRVAQDRTLAAGGKLSVEEQAKRKKDPLDRWGEITALAAEGRFPKGTDVFLTKYQGLFYVAPAQDSFMCRLRMPGGILTAAQFAGVADLADDLAGGFVDITTRANLQVREIPAAQGPEVIIRLSELGLTSRGSGADNVRNVTGSPTAGIDPQELLDTRPQARAIHHHILHSPVLFGLPRKFNIAFDGGGQVAVLEDTNDISFAAVQLTDGSVGYRLGFGGITGHRDFARETDIVVPPADTTAVCDAVLRVFIQHGDRTDRKKARLKYLLDRWGHERFVTEVEGLLGRKLTRVPVADMLPRPAQDKHGHLGVHPQRQPGLNYVGITCAVGRLTTDQVRGLAAVATRFGSATVRLTVWQNLILSDIADADLPAALEAIAALGLGWTASAVRGGLVACTGNAGCKFAASNTKAHAADLVAFLDPRITVGRPINIHLTGCHNSCAQHLIGDIGLLGARVERGEDSVEGYDLHVGGGAGPEQRIGRLVEAGIAYEDLPPKVLRLLQAWQAEAPEMSFQDWSAGQDDARLLALCVAEGVPA
jgi:ferredoxin-nitrite reductase